MTKMTKKEQDEFMKQYRQQLPLWSKTLSFIAKVIVFAAYFAVLFIVLSILKVGIDWGLSVW